ncbi:MAG TPA: hypothetical protein DCZ51_01695, partial [Bacteroidales bacterium]|nr:hypothetical protein [Bacteroidales bacterium]
GKNYVRDPATIGLSAHEQIYGPQSHIDELWRERFGLMYNDVFQSGGPNNSQQQKVWITTNDIYGKEVTILVPAKTIDGRWLPLGLNKPTLWVNEKKVNNPVISNFEGYYSMHIQVYGGMYSDYNWVQTVSGISNGKYNIGVDNRGVFNPGFYYSEMQKKDYKSTYQGDANMFFYDEPNFTDFNAELTLFGKKEDKWEIIQSFSWGYSANSETTGLKLIANWFPSLFHRIMTTWTLFRSNNWF